MISNNRQTSRWVVNTKYSGIVQCNRMLKKRTVQRSWTTTGSTLDLSLSDESTSWTIEEERRLVGKFVARSHFYILELTRRRLDRIVMPLLMLAFGILQYD